MISRLTKLSIGGLMVLSSVGLSGCAAFVVLISLCTLRLCCRFICCIYVSLCDTEAALAGVKTLMLKAETMTDQEASARLRPCPSLSSLARR